MMYVSHAFIHSFSQQMFTVCLVYASHDVSAQYLAEQQPDKPLPSLR